MAAVLKVTYQSEVRRCLLESASPSYEDITEGVAQLFPQAAGCTARYLDEEGDACTFCRSSLGDFLAQARAKGVAMAPAGGKVVLRLELVSLRTEGPAFDPPAAPPATEGEEAGEKEEPEAPDASAGAPSPAFAAFAHSIFEGKGHGKGKWKGKGKGKGKCGKGKLEVQSEEPWDHREWCQPEAPTPTLAEMLSPQALASALVCALPKAAAFLRRREHVAERAGHHLCAAVNLLSGLKEALQELWSLLSRSGLQRAEQALATFLTEVTPATAGSFLVSFVMDLETLPFAGQLEVLGAFFESQRERLQEMLWLLGQRLPFLPGLFVHQAVTCDGCGASPLLGLRFKCGSCPDYDLCAACFARKAELHGPGAEAAAHDFECKLSEATNAVHMKIMGHVFKHIGPLGAALATLAKAAGKGCEGKGKGKGKGKGADARPCATPGCGYQATWHATHCCGACVGGRGRHGGHCERKCLPAGGAAGSEPDATKGCPEECADKSLHQQGEEPPSTADEAKLRVTPKEPTSKATAEKAQRCTTAGCQYQATMGQHCCKACAKGCQHGPRCAHQIFHDTVTVPPAGHVENANGKEVVNTPDQDLPSTADEVKLCVTPGCEYQATMGQHCCKACAKGRDKHGPRCGKKVLAQQVITLVADHSEDAEGKEPTSKATAEKPQRCATAGCQYQATMGTHCCKACAKGCQHGPRCAHQIFHDTVTVPPAVRV